MVCDNSRRPGTPLNIKERAAILGLSYERALFLSRCAHSTNLNRKGDDQIVVIPYDVRVQLDEALRLGLGLDDVAEMMRDEITKDQILALGYKFPTKSRHPKIGGRCSYSLFQWEPLQSEPVRFALR
jgi:hypothetical protein